MKRVVSISVCHPVWATVIVDDNGTDGDQWEVVGVRGVTCDASARSINENMRDVDWEALDDAARKAKETP